jgi:hypothetical protein
MLVADFLDLQGELLSGRDLTLQAKDTVQVRDTVVTPFLAQAGGNLTIQGDRGIDILALNHRGNAFQSGSNLSLVSDGSISTDAHFASGRDFSIRTLGGLPGSFQSLKDPIFSVGGNHSVGDYRGASLQVTAGGNINYGTVVITAVDPAVHPTNPALFLNASGAITGTGEVSTTVAGGGLLINFQAGGDISTQGIITQGGAISLNSTSGAITANGTLNSSSNGSGNGGGITFQAEDDITTIGMRSVGSSFGMSGDITITSDTGAISINGGEIDSHNPETGKGGDINIAAVAGSIFLRNGARLNASTLGQGNAGSVNINARDTVSFDGIVNDRGERIGGVQSTVEGDAQGNGGNISITSESLFVTGGAQLLARNAGGQGDAGSVTLKARDTVSLSAYKGAGDGTPTVGTDVTNEGIGNGNNVNITARSVFIRDNAIVAASIISGRGKNGEPAQAGNVIITASDTVSVTNSVVFSEVGKDSVGNGGIINIDAPKVFLDNGASLITQVRRDGEGNGGHINIKTGSLSVTGGSQVVASTFGRGNAGNITINASDTVSFDGVGSNRFGINTFPQGGNPSGAFSTVERGAEGNNGGNIGIAAESLAVTNGARLIASTAGQENVGNVNIFTRDTAFFDGVGSNGENSGVFSSVEEGGVGKGGDINIITRLLRVTDGAQLNSRSVGQGDAGNLNVTANSVLLDNKGQLIAETASGEGGNIKLQVEDLLLMRRNSLISAQAFNNGNGGNIEIKPGLIVAVAAEDSDIVADAFQGNGGKIDITTQGIFGLEFRKERTLESDITASSRFGISGTVNVTELSVDFNQGLAALPSNLVDRTNQIDQGCSASEVNRENKFAVSGRGGLPQSPTEVISPNMVQDDFGTVTTGAKTHTDATPSTTGTNAVKQLVEARSWIVDDKGAVTLVAQASTATPQTPLLTPAPCQTSQK